MKRKNRIRSRVLALVMTAAIVFTSAVFSQAGTMKAEAAGPINGNVAIADLNTGDIIGPNTVVTLGGNTGDIVYKYDSTGVGAYESILVNPTVTYTVLKNAYENSTWNPAKGAAGSLYFLDRGGFQIAPHPPSILG